MSHQTKKVEIPERISLTNHTDEIERITDAWMEGIDLSGDRVAASYLRHEIAFSISEISHELHRAVDEAITGLERLHEGGHIHADSIAQTLNRAAVTVGMKVARMQALQDGGHAYGHSTEKAS